MTCDNTPPGAGNVSGTREDVGAQYVGVFGDVDSFRAIRSRGWDTLSGPELDNLAMGLAIDYLDSCDGAHGIAFRSGLGGGAELLKTWRLLALYRAERYTSANRATDGDA